MIACAYRLAAAPAGRRLFGLPAIASHIRAQIGKGSENSVARWSNDADNPLPLYRWGGGVIAVVDEIDKWIAKGWKLESPHRHHQASARGA
jgi:hypothetical protein